MARLSHLAHEPFVNKCLAKHKKEIPDTAYQLFFGGHSIQVPDALPDTTHHSLASDCRQLNRTFCYCKNYQGRTTVVIFHWVVIFDSAQTKHEDATSLPSSKSLIIWRPRLHPYIRAFRLASSHCPWWHLLIETPRSHYRNHSAALSLIYANQGPNCFAINTLIASAIGGIHTHSKASWCRSIRWGHPYPRTDWNSGAVC